MSPSSSSFSESGAGDTDTITARISTPAPAGGVTIALGFSGTAVANLDYTIGTNGVNNAVLTSSLPVEIFIPQGQTTGSITLTGASNSDVVSNESLNVSVISVNGVVPSTPVQANLSIGNTGFPIISIENLTVTEPNASSTAQVTVQLSGLDLDSADDRVHDGHGNESPRGNRCSGRLGSASAYTPVLTPTIITIPANTSSVTIPITVTGDPTATQPETFLVELLGTPVRKASTRRPIRRPR